MSATSSNQKMNTFDLTQTCLQTAHLSTDDTRPGFRYLVTHPNNPAGFLSTSA